MRSCTQAGGSWNKHFAKFGCLSILQLLSSLPAVEIGGEELCNEDLHSERGSWNKHFARFGCLAILQLLNSCNSCNSFLIRSPSEDQAQEMGVRETAVIPALANDEQVHGRHDEHPLVT